MVDSIRDVFYGTRQKFERLEYAVGGGNGRLGEISVEELDCVREKTMLGDGIDHV